MRFVELFAGIGGFSLGFERAGMECVGHVEIDPYAQKVLLKHWPDVKLLEDVKKVKGDEFGKVDLLCGGFPCQDLSVAGKQAGITGERSGLFDEIIRIAGVCGPRYIVLENVANLLSRSDWFGYVLGRLAQIGYDAEWEIIRASDVGAPHKRARVWIVAYTNSNSKSNGSINEGKGQGELDEQSTDTNKTRLQSGFEYCHAIPKSDSWRDAKPGVCRVDDGIPNQVDRLKCLGNALVPQIAEYIGEQILSKEEKTR